MTGGCIVVLGETGLNFGAGMTGGFAFIYDGADRFAHRYNNELIDINRINSEDTGQYREFLRDKIERHVKLTGSARGQMLLDNFSDVIGKFWLVKPKAAKLDSMLKD
jgi:glutamate synthase (NADPH/NADH) large chain